jgi:hypothetical protein
MFTRTEASENLTSGSLNLPTRFVAKADPAAAVSNGMSVNEKVLIPYSVWLAVPFATLDTVPPDICTVARFTTVSAP